jgi:hypothetical protein
MTTCGGAMALVVALLTTMWMCGECTLSDASEVEVTAFVPNCTRLLTTQ